MNAEFLSQMRATQENAMRMMFQEIQTAMQNNAANSGGGGARGDLRDRMCRELGPFKGEEVEWK